MSLDPSSLIAGFIFGVFGLAVFRHGKKNVNYNLLAIGAGMMIYPYFVENPWLNWGIGFALSYGAYYFWNY
jgi:hypothetical protein